jgi:hypothetical protein
VDSCASATRGAASGSRGRGRERVRGRLRGRPGREGVGESVFVGVAREAGSRVAVRCSHTLTRIAHAHRCTLVATAHATAHTHAGPENPLPQSASRKIHGPTALAGQQHAADGGRKANHKGVVPGT